MQKELSQIAKARSASGMTIGNASKIVGLSYPTYKAREDNPGSFTMNELSSLTKAFNREGNDIFKGWVSSFFDM